MTSLARVPAGRPSTRPIVYVITPDELDVRGRAVRAYRAATDGLSVFAFDIRKARSETQAPSALERVMRQLIELKARGVGAADARQLVVALSEVVDDLYTGKESPDLDDLLDQAQHFENAENLAEFKVVRGVRNVDTLREFAKAKRAEGLTDLECARAADRLASRACLNSAQCA